MTEAIERLVVIDFEATCSEDGEIFPQEIIEMPCVVIDVPSRTIVKDWRTYVRPVHHPTLTQFCTSLTGITQEQVDGAPTFDRAYAQWLDEVIYRDGRKTAYVTCGDWDLKTMLPYQVALYDGLEIPQELNSWINIKKVLTKFVNTGRPRKEHIYIQHMQMMLDHFGLELVGRHHSGLDDSRNIARVCIALLERGYVF